MEFDELADDVPRSLFQFLMVELVEIGKLLVGAVKVIRLTLGRVKFSKLAVELVPLYEEVEHHWKRIIVVIVK